MKKTIILYATLGMFIVIACVLSGCACKHEHTKLLSNTATCDKAGTATYYCYDCEKNISKPSVAAGHYFSTLVSDTATCTSSGYKTYKCSRCETTKDLYSAATGHDYSGIKCVNCGKVDPEYKEIKLSSNLSWSSELYETSGGSTWFICSIKASSGSTQARAEIVGMIRTSVCCNITMYDQDGRYLGHALVAASGSYQVSSAKTNFTLSHTVHAGDVIYIHVNIF